MTTPFLRRLAGVILCAMPIVARAQPLPSAVTALRFGAMAEPSPATVGCVHAELAFTRAAKRETVPLIVHAPPRAASV